jgi:hypothetical protein
LTLIDESATICIGSAFRLPFIKKPFLYLTGFPNLRTKTFIGFSGVSHFFGC